MRVAIDMMDNISNPCICQPTAKLWYLPAILRVERPFTCARLNFGFMANMSFQLLLLARNLVSFPPFLTAGMYATPFSLWVMQSLSHLFSISLCFVLSWHPILRPETPPHTEHLGERGDCFAPFQPHNICPTHHPAEKCGPHGAASSTLLRR